MLGNLTLIDLSVLVVVWFVTSMLANLLWTRFVLMRYTGRAFMNWLGGVLDGNDEKGTEILNRLANFFFIWVGSAQIRTGKKIKLRTEEKDKDGNFVVEEIEEILTPVDMLGRTIGNYAIMKIKGQTGGTKSQIGRMLQEEAAESGLGLSPAAIGALSKGKLGPALMELAVPHIQKNLNKKQNDTSSGGSSQGW